MKCKYEGTGVWAGRCTGTKEIDPCIGYANCSRFKGDYQTNADRIRAMSDEDLAEFLAPSFTCYACPSRALCDKSDGKDCNQVFLEWLKQPYMDNEYCKFETMLSEAPTVDAVPVVRCRECFGRNCWEKDENGCDICLVSGLYVRGEDDYCPYGERKEGAD